MKSIALATSFVSMWAAADTKILHSEGSLIQSGDKIYSVGTITVHYVEQHKFDRIKAKRGDSYSGFISALDSWEEMESNSYWEAAGNFNTVMGVLPDKMNTIDIRIAKNENNPIFDLYINDTKVVSKIDSRIKMYVLHLLDSSQILITFMSISCLTLLRVITRLTLIVLPLNQI